MVKTLLIASFLLVSFTGCQNDTALAPGQFEKDIPVWLQVKINSISTNQFYYSSEVYRYEWKGKNVYHIMVPLSSCAFCELYSENGTTLTLSAEEFSDFVAHKKNVILIWKWEDA